MTNNSWLLRILLKLWKTSFFTMINVISVYTAPSLHYACSVCVHIFSDYKLLARNITCSWYTINSENDNGEQLSKCYIFFWNGNWKILCSNPTHNTWSLHRRYKGRKLPTWNTGKGRESLKVNLPLPHLSKLCIINSIFKRSTDVSKKYTHSMGPLCFTGYEVYFNFSIF